MKTKTVLLILLAGLVLAADATAHVFVATNSTWRYFKGTSEASSPTNVWRELAFDDSAWLTGAAPFHYGTNIVGGDDKLTGGTILTDMRSNFTCVFLRHEFVIDDTNIVRGLWLNVWFDDGLGIWINGQPARSPILLGGLAYTDTATSFREGSTVSRIDISAAIASLRSGTNVLCLQAVNRCLADDDFRIDAELAETPGTFAFATNACTVREDATQLVVRVVRTGALDAGLTVDYATTNGSAVAGSDYEAVSGRLSFAEGQTEQPIAVSILNDALIEDTEGFQIKLSNPGGGATLGSPSTANVQLTESQTPPVPHHFSGITLGRDQTAMLGLDGSALRMFNLTGTLSNQFMQMFDLYVVEASTNLADWTRLAVLPRTNSDPTPLLFHDTNAAGLSQRFYRTFTNHLVTGFPTPTGPFAVGTFSRVLTDPSRSNRYGIATNSSFLSTFWYPADPARASLLPGPCAESAVAGDRSFYSYWGFSLAWANVMSNCVGHAVAGLPLVAGTNRFPVIMHSHGWTCDRRFNSQVAEELASHGYIVAAVDHEDCHATVFPDARGTRYVAPGSRTDAALLTSRVKDLQWPLDELAVMDGSDPVLAGRLDLSHIGVTGFSLGGGTAAETCRVDNRIQCAALLDAALMLSYYPDLNSQGLQKPFLAMNRTILDHNPSVGDLAPDSQHLYTLATSDAVWLKIANTGHFAFSDCAWAVEMTPGSRQGAAAINACLVWFFDTYLKGEMPPFPTNPEIYNVHRK